jgi:Zn-dependent membrane protease YugP
MTGVQAPLRTSHEIGNPLKHQVNYTAEQIKLYLFVLFLVELFLFSLSLVGGRFLGYKTALWVGAGIGIVIGVCFVTIIAANLIMIWIQKVIERIIKHGRT